ncbi:MAG: hypothetical protein ACLGI9_19585 [Thermoanaerobaculia bacterium]
MAFKIELTILGLCAFVPDEPIQYEQEDTISGMTVLVLDSRQMTTVSNRGNPPVELDVCSHLPMLRFPRPEENKLSGFWLLDGHRIEIDGIDTGTSLQIAPSFGKGSRMEKVLADKTGLVDPNPARVDPKFLANVPPADIAGRMDLAAGRVEAFGSTGMWDFDPPVVPVYRDSFTTEVRVTFQVPGQFATLRASPRQGAALEQELRPKPGSQSVKLLLSNLCLDDPEHDGRVVEEDFVVFYRLLTNYDGVCRVPKRGASPGGGPGVPGQANASPSCVDTRMAAKQG